MGQITDGYAFLGVERPADPKPAESPTGESTQEPAEPAQNVTPEGEKDRESANPETDKDNADEGESVTDDTEPPEWDPAEPEPMSREERAKNAARRRDTERREAVDNARKEERETAKAEFAKEQDKFVKGLKLTNPFTKKPVSTVAEYNAYIEERDRKTVDDGLNRAGLNREVIDTLIDEHPDVKKARELSASAADEKAQVENVKVEQRREKILGELTALDPDVKSWDDLEVQENYSEVYDKVKKGYALVDAYKLVNEDKLQKRRNDALRQQAINDTRGKNHMQSTEIHGNGGSITVPAHVSKGYREMFPGITDTEIRQKYTKVVKATKKG